MSTPTKYDDVIDSRDVIARIEELQSEREGLTDDIELIEELIDEIDPDADPDMLAARNEELRIAREALAEWDADNAQELKELTDLASEGEDYSSDWKYGETLIRDSYFRDYAQELAEELDLVKKDVNWPYPASTGIGRRGSCSTTTRLSLSAVSTTGSAAADNHRPG